MGWTSFGKNWALLCLVIAPLMQAQETRWQNLSEIASGTKVQVVEMSLKSNSGKFVRFSETDLTIRTDKGEIVVSREQVYRVTVTGKNRKRNVLIGLGAGAAVGAGIGAATKQVVNEAGVIPGLMGAFGAVGAGIGAVLPAGKTVYRAELPKQVGEIQHPKR